MPSQIDFSFSTPASLSDLYKLAKRKDRRMGRKFEKLQKEAPLHLLVRNFNFIVSLEDRMEEEKRSAALFKEPAAKKARIEEEDPVVELKIDLKEDKENDPGEAKEPAEEETRSVTISQKISDVREEQSKDVGTPYMLTYSC
uniref:HRDC domain-containing protein n=1 Tax=Caenorhabditis tropicalis TaxID=1561998 RepID=A0A1I7TGN4_9PELO